METKENHVWSLLGILKYFIEQRLKGSKYIKAEQPLLNWMLVQWAAYPLENHWGSLKGDFQGRRVKVNKLPRKECEGVYWNYSKNSIGYYYNT
jgi:hypothetical protein